MQEKFYNLTNPQKSIWNTEEVFKGTSINNICTSGLIYEKIDLELLKKAIKLVVKQNDSFRLHITLQDGKVKQYISNFQDFDIDVQYINSKDELSGVEQTEAKHVFNILDSDLFRFKIVILKDVFTCVILTAHHIVSDSWSMGLTIQAILKNYHLLSKGIAPNFEATSYTDYIETEKKYKFSQKFDLDKKYWQNIFDTVPEQALIPSLSASVSENNVQLSLPGFAFDENTSQKANRRNFDIDKKITKKITDYCKDNKISIFAFFMAIFSIYISKVSNKTDFVIGTPILNRINKIEKNTMGMFVNTVPIRVSMSNSSFIDFVNLFSKNFMGVLRHQKYSYNSILEDLRKKYDNIPNLYNIIISYQVTKAFDKEIGNYETHWTFSNYIANDIDIHIYDINDTGSLSVSYDYLTSKFSKKDIEDIHLRICYMITQVLNNPNIMTNEFEIITEEEKHKILYDFNNTFRPYPKEKTIIELFEEQVLKNPNSTAVVFEGEKLTYKELSQKANSLAVFLHCKGLKPKEVVGIFVDKSIESIVAILAILKCGCSYMPIDIDYPLERIKYMLKDSATRFILTTKEFKSRLDYSNNVICIDLENNDVFVSNISNYNLEKQSSDDTAYIMYTSGSTGKPKGVMVSNKNVVRLVKNTNFIAFKEHERILQTGSIVFDACTFEIWGALLNGFELYIIKKQDLLDPIELKKYLDTNKITIMWITAPLFNQLSKQNPKIFENIRVLLTGGDVLSPKHINLVKDACPKLTIINGYGPTENTTFSTCFTINKKYEDSIPIGYPIANSTCYIVSSDFKLLPIGVPGELVVGGDGVSKGYLNNTSKTKENFLPNIFGQKMVYRTGDLACWLPDGSIKFLGRIDNQVKIRGFRVELGEVILAIQKFDNIKEAICVIKEFNGEKYICAYFSAEEKIDVSVLKKYLRNHLPHYAIPTYFVQVDKMPINANGKIDKSKLPEPQICFSSINQVLPRNDTEYKLIDILKRILNVESLSVDDDFLDIGLDSLSAINFSTQIQNQFGVHVDVRDILEHPCVQDLSSLISSYSNTQSNSISLLPHAEFYELSSSQKRIYFSSKMAGNNSTLYNIPGGIILTGNIDINNLERCLNILINRHESLRTYFELEKNSNRVVQKICAHVDFKLNTQNNADFNELNTLFKNFVKPFDLSVAPLFRAEYISFDNNKSALFIDMHHIISDGTSLSIFTDELCKLYNGANLDKINFTFKDFAKLANDRLKNGFFTEAEQYWTNQFSGEIPVLNLPTSFPRPAVQDFKGKKIFSTLERKAVEDLAKKLGITPYMLLLSCYYILLSKYSSQDDIVIGSPIVGRDMVETQNIVGMFVNTLALRNSINCDLSFKDFALNIKNNILEAFKYQTYPFDELVNKLNITRDASRNPLFDVMFIYQNNGYKSINLQNIKAKYYIPDTNTSKFDLSLEAVPQGNEITLSFEYATSLYDDDFIEDLSSHYLNILNSITENPYIKIADICMLSGKERYRLLHEFNNTYLSYPNNKTMSQLFETQVQNNPNNVAVRFKNTSLTYVELDEKANCLANCLINNGISNDDVVAIMLNRSFDLIISIYAVIKCGATYVLIDKSFPDERKNYIIQDSGAKYCLTDEYLNIENVNLNVIDFNTFDYSKYNCKYISNTCSKNMCIIYTSGSTGNPKGVLLNEQGFINLVYGFDKEMNISNYKNILGIASVSFDMFAVELFSSTLFGNTLVLANEEEQKNPIGLSNLIKENNVEFFITTPSRVQMLLSEECGNPLKNIKAFQLGGEVFTKSLYEQLKNATKAKIFNGYGPTEITACCTNKFVTDNNITIGKPICNEKVYICDSRMKLVPIGVIGEICISGVGVSNGYLNKPDTTKLKFIPNPFGSGYIYRTGDLGKFNKYGEIEYIGRSDTQVKIRGLRIELGEIESLILKYPNVKNVCIIKQILNEHDYLSAYLTASEDIDVSSLKAYLTKKIPLYMVPSYFTILDDFPYTASGKIDTKSLPLPKIVYNDNYVEPKTELQKELANIWKKLLNIKNISIYDNFFDIGGDSLLAMSLNVELQKLSDTISYSDIFRYPTIFDLEQKIYSNNDSLYFGKIENLSDSIVDVLQNSSKKIKLSHFSPKSILLTGSTGFLGIHVLQQFIENEQGNIYCIIRDSKKINAKNKLISKLNYYFGNKYTDLIDKRIFVVTGDVSKNNFGLDLDTYTSLAKVIDVVINCAANVFHYGSYKDFYNVNVKSVEYCIDFCKNYNKKLYHISTTSISGSGADLSLLYKKRRKIKLKESDFYIGQLIDNVYSRSKFEAESLVLSAISKGLDGYIFRMGNLMPRYSDGAFQENVLANAFISKILSFIKIGKIPEYLQNYKLEFTPIDFAANAIYKIVTNFSNKNRVFHLYNHHTIRVKKFIKELKKNNISANIINNEDFKNYISDILSNDDKKSVLKNLIDDFDKNMNLDYDIDISIKSNYTIKYLRKTKFKWPKITNTYLDNFIDLLRRVI